MMWWPLIHVVPYVYKVCLPRVLAKSAYQARSRQLVNKHTNKFFDIVNVTLEMKSHAKEGQGG